MNQRQLFFSKIGQTSPFPLAFPVEKAEGIYITSDDQKKYADLICGIGVSVIGHRHPNVIEAIKNQLDKYLHTMVFGEHIQSPQVRLADQLLKIAKGKFEQVYFTNSGSEAVEGALKITKKYTGRQELISCSKAYHGSTSGASSLMDSNYFHAGYEPFLPNVKHIQFNDFNALQKITERTAAFILEPIQAEAGIISPNQGYLQAVRSRCDETGCLMILDEIQSGIGRTGEWLASHKYNVEPDLILLGKALGGGLPLGAILSSEKIMKVISNHPILGHITTFGGNPVCCAAALATLEVIEHEKLLDAITTKADSIINLLNSKKIKDLRVNGLWAAIELSSFEEVQFYSQELMKAGILLDWFLFNDKSLRLAPPLNIDQNEFAYFLDKINNILQ